MRAEYGGDRHASACSASVCSLVPVSALGDMTSPPVKGIAAYDLSGTLLTTGLSVVAPRDREKRSVQTPTAKRVSRSGLTVGRCRQRAIEACKHKRKMFSAQVLSGRRDFTWSACATARGVGPLAAVAAFEDAAVRRSLDLVQLHNAKLVAGLIARLPRAVLHGGLSLRCGIACLQERGLGRKRRICHGGGPVRHAASSYTRRMHNVSKSWPHLLVQTAYGVSQPAIAHASAGHLTFPTIQYSLQLNCAFLLS